MAYVKRIVCLANSFKIGGSCIAGREVLGNGQFGGWIRPVSARATAEVTFSEYKYQDNTSPKLLDIIDVTMLNPDPRRHQTENHVIDAAQPWAKVAEFPWADFEKIRDKPASIWIKSDRTGGGCYDCISEAEAGTLHDSLALIKPDGFGVEVGKHYYTGKRTYRGNFDYNGTHYNLSLTDPVAINAFAAKGDGAYPLDNVYICVSLTEPWKKDKNRCHKLVAAIFSNPPL
jgi:hypothetical protein